MPVDWRRELWSVVASELQEDDVSNLFFVRLVYDDRSLSSPLIAERNCLMATIVSTRWTSTRWLFFLTLTVFGLAWSDDHGRLLAQDQEPAVTGTMTQEEAVAFFQNQVQPILVDKCIRCHNPDELAGSLSLTTREGFLEGGDSGPAVDLESLDDSVLLGAINYDDYEMPPTGKMSDENIAIIRKWIHLGMPWSEDHAELEMEAGHQVPQVNDETRSWWSFQPVQRPQVPEIDGSDWPANEIDHFVLARLQSEGLRPNPDAHPRDLVRRLYYDLLGLPPTKAQADAFVADPSPEAYQKLVDELLASPHYGEKWGRFWLDLVRYAETNSFERDGDKPFVWKYRDYVINSLNQDKPYDQFLIEQLAGDELPDRTIETVTATGYYRLGQWDDEPADPELARFDELDDILRTTTEVTIGLTVGCARCHDHKIDPIPQKDYYRLLAVFNNMERYGVRSPDSVEESSIVSFHFPVEDEKKVAHQKRLADVESAIQEIVAKVKPDFEPVEHEEWQYEENHVRLIEKREGNVLTKQEVRRFQKLFRRRQQLLRNPPSNDVKVLAVKEQGPESRDTFVMIRGNAHVTGDQVEPGFPSVLSPPEPRIEQPAHGKSTGRRLALARWLTSPDHPLTSRVMANRIWQGHFGRGIVRTASDFGFQGSPPTHPQLLDWLASELVANDWKLKSLHRTILLSRTYRMSSENRPEAYDQDPTNDLMWRFDLRRLTAEEIRDSILAASGSLNLQDMLGPSIFPVMPEEVLAGQSQPGSGWGDSPQSQRDRRSVYIKIKRSLVLPILQNYDVPETDFSCAVRFNTVQPTQALGMLNSEFTNFEAGRMATEILQQTDISDVEAQVRQVIHRVTQRPAEPDEVESGVAFIQQMRSRHEMDPHHALTKFCLIGLNLNEFIYLR